MRRSAFKIPLRNSRLLIFGVFAAQGIHILSMYVPATQRVLKVAPVSLQEWGALLLFASIILVTMEIFKVVKKKAAFSQA